MDAFDIYDSCNTYNSHNNILLIEVYVMTYQEAAEAFVRSAFYLIDKYEKDPNCFGTSQCLLDGHYILRINMHGNLYIIDEQDFTNPIEYLYYYNGHQMDRIGNLLTSYLVLLQKDRGDGNRFISCSDVDQIVYTHNEVHND